MEVLVRGRHVLMSAALHSYCERRISFSIGRFRHRVTRVVVVVTRARNASRASEISCRMIATLPGKPDIVAEQRAPRDAYAAVDLAVRTLAESVARELERERALRIELPPMDPTTLGPGAMAPTGSDGAA